MKFQILHPTCNLDTVTDGRGGIFTWIPKEPIVEYNMLYFTPGTSRGFHYHPHFIEYMLIVDGSGTMVVREDKGKSNEQKIIHLSKGVSTRTETNVYHTVYAITNLTAIAMLTKKWDDCDPPIVRIDETK